MYKIVIDSCGELTEELKRDGHFSNVPLELEVDGVCITDDETFDQLDFIQRVKKSIRGPKSACPSPERYLRAYEGDCDNVYVVTLSDKLSGSYNSAVIAAQMFQEEYADRNIHVFNSRSASIGETLIGLKLRELEESGLDFAEVVARTEEYISSMNTFFVLETLETFRKNGRLGNLKAMVVSTLNIKPVMGSTKEGTIQQLGQAIGMKKALARMVEDMLKVTKNCENRILAVAHCNCPERAEFVRQLIQKVAKFKDIVIVNTAGVSTMYANDGGIILAV